jgi:glycerol-3-phosphate dehydrogenase
MAQAPRISTPDRAANLDRLEAGLFDCVIVGGGITGAGIAREATERGLTAALLEAKDFSSGTSSRSSKLIHGGLRYLAMGDVLLVRETARERKAIRLMAPHLAEPRWMVVPVRSRRGLLKMRAAIAAYERLGGVEEGDLHRNWSAEDLKREEPALRRSEYRWACSYREYLTDDARLVLANLRAAVLEGATALNYARVDGLFREGERVAGVEAICRWTGRRIRVRGRCVINAAGPWVEAMRSLEDPSAPPLLHLSKGIHVVLLPERIPIRNMIVLGTADGRSIFVIRRGEVVYVGTTDTTYPRSAEEWPQITSGDVEYLLEPLPRCLNVEPVKPDEVVAAWAGLRPLISEPGKKPTEISRRDEILIGPGGVVTIAGGKLTGYRLMARRTVEKAAAVAGLELRPGADDPRPLPGGDFDGDLGRLSGQLARQGAPGAAAERLARLYGVEALELLEDGFHPLVEGGSVAAEEVDWAILMEGAVTLEDVLYRRTRVPFYDPSLRERVVEPVADRMAALLGWDASRRMREVESVRGRLTQDLAFATGGSA